MLTVRVISRVPRAVNNRLLAPVNGATIGVPYLPGVFGSTGFPYRAIATFLGEKMADALQLLKDYVQVVLKYEMSQTDEDFEACETIWLKMVELAQGGE